MERLNLIQSQNKEKVKGEFVMTWKQMPLILTSAVK